MSSVFQNISGNHPRKNLFNLSYDVKTTLDMGQLIPVMCDEVVPGDTFKISNQAVARFAPLVAPVMHEVNLFTHYFFVPYRLLWEDWENFITGGKDGDFAAVPPHEYSLGVSDKGTLWDYLGFPVIDDTSLGVNAFPFRAYNLVWNEYYRDENLDDEVDIDNRKILYRRWRKDYFTSAFLSTQRGDQMGIKFNAFITGLPESRVFEQLLIHLNRGDVRGDVSDQLYNLEQRLLAVTPPNPNDQNAQNQSIYGATSNSPVGTPYVTHFSSEIANLDNNLRSYFTDLGISSNAVSIADLRLAVQIQRFKELNMRSGYRYTEFLKAHFGVAPTDARLDRPEFIGGSRSPILFNEVLQTSSTDSVSPQGNMAGRGITADRNFIGKYRVPEFGCIIGIVSVMPRANYQQGVNRQWSRLTRYDYYFPEFAHLSEQAILFKELYADGSSRDNVVWGFQGRYNEMRYKPSLVTGQMRDTFDYWHLGRKFANPPSLNSSFIECKPDKRIFASQTEPGIYLWYANHIKAARPLPKNPTPGLVDHI